MALRTLPRLAAAALAMAATAVLGAPPAPAAAATPAPPTLVLLQPTTASIAAGTVKTVVRVSTGGYDAVQFSVSVNTARKDVRVPKTTCPTTCDITTNLDLTTFDVAAPSGTYIVDVIGWGDSGDVTSDGINVRTTIQYLALTAPVTVAAFTPEPTANIPWHAAYTSDTKTTFTTALNSANLVAGEGAEVRVWATDTVGYATGPALRTAQGTWASTPNGIRAEVPVDTSTLSEGRYIYQIRSFANPLPGMPLRYGPGTSGTLLVAHNKAIDLTWRATALRPTDAPRITVTAHGPLPTAPLPGDLRLTVDGVTTRLPAVAWFEKGITSPGRVGTAVYTLDPLPLGNHETVAQLLDVNGAPMGPELRTTLVVAQLTVTGTTPSMATVTEPATIELSGTTPAGNLLSGCTYTITDGAGQVTTGTWCTDGTTTNASQKLTWTPTVTGRATVSWTATLQDGTMPTTVTRTVVVYPQRTGRITAMTGTYGTKVPVTATLLERTSPTTTGPAPAGIAVSFQLQRAGTTTWSSMGTAMTDSRGVATLAATSTANGLVRASFARAGTTATTASPTQSSVCRAALAWITAPTSTTKGAVTTFSISTKPYESAARVSLQVAPPGSTWRTVKTVATATTGTATTTYAFPSTGTWSYRVVRSGTPLITTVTTAARTIAVR